MRYLKLVVLVMAVLSMLTMRASVAHPGDLPANMLAYVKRDGLMHLIRGQQYILQEMLVGKREIDQAEFVRAAKSLAALFSMIPSTFEPNLTVEISRARPEIWQNWDDFVARAAEFQKLAEELAAMGEIRGAEATIDRVRQFDCGICHDVYRK